MPRLLATTSKGCFRCLCCWRFCCMQDIYYTANTCCECIPWSSKKWNKSKTGIVRLFFYLGLSLQIQEKQKELCYRTTHTHTPYHFTYTCLYILNIYIYIYMLKYRRYMYNFTPPTFFEGLLWFSPKNHTQTSTEIPSIHRGATSKEFDGSATNRWRCWRSKWRARLQRNLKPIWMFPKIGIPPNHPF